MKIVSFCEVLVHGNISLENHLSNVTIIHREIKHAAVVKKLAK
jgi:hypothetical protein